jgi:hypothetical protein
MLPTKLEKQQKRADTEVNKIIPRSEIFMLAINIRHGGSYLERRVLSRKVTCEKCLSSLHFFAKICSHVATRQCQDLFWEADI